MIDRIDTDLRGQFLPVRDQGRRPTCLAYAASAAHEHIRRFPEHLSSEYLYYHAKTAVGRGCKFSRVAKTLAKEGQPIERDCPAQSSSPPSSWMPAATLSTYRRDSVAGATSLHSLRTTIAAGQAPVIGIQVPEGFFTPRRPYVVDDRGPRRGYHAVVAVGYGRHEGIDVLLIRNSWGDSWADSGYAWLTETFLQAHLKEVLVLTGDLT